MFLKKHNKTALIFGKNHISYSELFKQIARFSEFTSKSAAKKIAIFSENRLDWVYAFYAGWYCDCVNIPIDFMSTSSEAAYILNDSKPDIIFTSNDNIGTLKEALKTIDHSIEVINFDELETNEVISIEKFPEEDRERTAVIIYTSGTTGSPKGVMLSFNNIFVNVDAVCNQVPIIKYEYNVLALLPMHHILPLLGSLVAPLYIGGTTIFTPSLASEDIMKTLEENPVHIIIGVPRFYSIIRKGIKSKINASLATKLIFKLAELLKSEGFSKKIFKKVHEKMGGNIKYLVCGGAAVEEEVARDMKTLGFELLVGYGMTETAPMITFPRPKKVVINASGKALPGCEIKIVDGEVTVRGPQVMQGYYNREQETSDVIKEGWLHTGDLGKIDDNGNLFITGRKKEIIVTDSGKNINPVEVEFKILEMTPLIAEIGVYMEDNTLKAAVYPDFKAIKDYGVVNIEESLRSDVFSEYNTLVSPYKRIRHISIVKEELPKTRLGKLKRYELAKLASQDHKKTIKQEYPKYKEFELIAAYLLEEKHKEVSADDHLELDVNMDSLDIVGLQFFLKSTFGIEMSNDDILDYPTVGKLAEYVKGKKIKIDTEAVQWSEILKENLDMEIPNSWFTHPILKNITSLIMKLYFKVKSEGVDKLPDAPFILAPNHQSYLDSFFVAMFLKNKIFRKTYFYAKKKHFKFIFAKFVARTNNIIIVDINKDLKQSLQKLAAALKKGKNVIIFPEGTRSHSGKIGNFKKTFAILSRELQVPVVPVAIDGAHSAMPRGTIFPRPFKKINVKFLDPVYPKDMSYDKLKDVVYSMVDKAMKK